MSFRTGRYARVRNLLFFTITTACVREENQD
jgi:hypothetical protein